MKKSNKNCYFPKRLIDTKFNFRIFQKSSFVALLSRWSKKFLLYLILKADKIIIIIIIDKSEHKKTVIYMYKFYYEKNKRCLYFFSREIAQCNSIAFSLYQGRSTLK